MFDFIVAHLQTSVPFASYVGVEIVTLDEEGAVARLPENAECLNHIGSVHAGALFTLAEAASGAAMAGALAPVLMEIRPTVADSTITYLQVARGALEAKARMGIAASEIRQEISQNGRARFLVQVSIFDTEKREVANMDVHWHVKKTTA